MHSVPDYAYKSIFVFPKGGIGNLACQQVIQLDLALPVCMAKLRKTRSAVGNCLRFPVYATHVKSQEDGRQPATGKSSRVISVI